MEYVLNLLAADWNEHAESSALSDGSTVLTYRQLSELVESNAQRLRAGGVAPGESVAVAVGGIAGAVATLAVSAVGAVPALCNAAWWARELRAALDGYEPVHTLATAESATMIDGRDGLLVTEAADLLTPTTSPLQRRSAPSSSPTGQPTPGTAALVFTTGVWSRPRPYEVLANVMDQIWLRDAKASSAQRRTTLLGIEAGHALGLRLLVETLSSGHHLQLAPAITLRALARRLEASPAHCLWLGGPQANALALALSHSASLAHAVETAGLETIFVGNGVLRPWAARLLAECSGAEICERYTLTEAGGWADGPGLTLTSNDGCLHIDGPGALVAGPTGDRGVVAPAGTVVHGRIGDDFLSDGLAVRPAVVEAALARHRDVADVAIVPRPDPTRGSIGVAVLVPRNPDLPPFLGDLREVMEDLDPHERPLAQTIQSTLVQTAAGHVHRRMLTYEEASR